jgi:polysaccharide deacetylase family protein (PEP-CTERM system associated)
MHNVMSVDVEDYFHPTEVQGSNGPLDWDAQPSRVEPATSRVLDLLARHNVRATFFILGWVAERFPALIRRIADSGHDLACHSHTHQLVYELGPARFREDTCRARDVIAQAAGTAPIGYRAPSYSVTNNSLWALEILAELGFRYDSSIYPIQHDRYGIPGYSRAAQWVHTPSGPILEIPPAAVGLSSNRTAPVGGGGYLRLLPYAYTAAGIRRLNFHDRIPAMMYFHPWEIDPGTPRLANGVLARLRTYLGLGAMERKLDRLLADFAFTSVPEAFPEVAATQPTPGSRAWA